MSISVKYAVFTEDHTQWVITHTRKHFERLFEDHTDYPEIKKYIDENYAPEALVRRHNDFSRQMLMAFEGTQPLASAELVSMLLPEQQPENSDRPLLIHRLLHDASGRGLSEILRRSEEIAFQKKHDALIVRAFDNASVTRRIIEEQGFEDYGTGKSGIDHAEVKEIIYTKKIR